MVCVTKKKCERRITHIASVYTNTHIYIYREREREGGREYHPNNTHIYRERENTIPTTHTHT